MKGKSGIPYASLAPLALGTSAWSYADWRGIFYPEKLPQARLLEWYSAYFGAVEVDSTFYHSPSAKATAHWAEVTPPDFRFTAKLVRAITHENRLRESDALLTAFLKGLEPLGAKLGVVLVQLPPGFKPSHDGEALERFVERLPEEWRFAIEFRDPEWQTERYIACLRQHRVAWAWTDTMPYGGEKGAKGVLQSASQATLSSLLAAAPQTAPFAYIRLLGDLQTKFNSGGKRQIERYDHIRWPREAALHAWAAKVRATQESGMPVFCFAANHFEGCSPLTVQRLGAELGVNVKFPDLDAEKDGGQLGLL